MRPHRNAVGGLDFPSELAHVEVVVEAALGKKLIVGSPFDDLAIFDRDDLIGVTNRAKSVSNHERGPTTQKLLERLLPTRPGQSPEVGAGPDSARFPARRAPCYTHPVVAR